MSFRKKASVGIATAAACAAGLATTVGSATADPRTLLVTLTTGQTVTLTVDVPPGTPVDAIAIPTLAAPVASVQDITPPPAPEPEPEPEPEPKPVPAPPKPTTPTAPTAPKPPVADKPEVQTPSDSGPKAPARGDKDDPGKDDPKKDRNAKDRDAKGKDDQGRGGVEGPGGETRGGKSERIKKTDAGIPTPTNPSFSLAVPGPAPIGVPNFFIDRFRIPPFLLPIYQAAGIEYNVPWQVLAAINEIETDYGRNLNVSSAGALGWMQFMPPSWEAYGVDANGDGRKDPYNPVDAIFAAARYLKAANAETDLRAAIFAYNRADWYVESVLLRARLIGGLPNDLVGSLTGLTQNQFPVAAEARYAGAIDTRSKRVGSGNAAVPVESDDQRRGIEIFADEGSPVIAVGDGKIVKIGRSARLGRYVVLEDVYGNRYTYARLGKISKWHAVPKQAELSAADLKQELDLPAKDPKPGLPASAGAQPRDSRPAKGKKGGKGKTRNVAPAIRVPKVMTSMRKERLFADPARPAAYRNGGEDQLEETPPKFTTFKAYFTRALGLRRSDVEVQPLEVGSQVIGGTILGRVGQTTADKSAHLYFEIRPAGRGAPRIDPKPILDGWKLLESTAIYRASGKNPFFGADANNATVGQILLMSKQQLERRVLADPRIELDENGRSDVRGGRVDRRILATLSFLSASGLRPTVSSIASGRSSIYTASGNLSAHPSGNAVDIPMINGIPILGNQGAGSITDTTIRRLLTLQGSVKPAQIISLMQYPGTDNTLALADHNDHIHVGFTPSFNADSKLGRQVQATLKPDQWLKLIDRLGEIPNPTVPIKPSKYSLDVKGERDQVRD